MEYHNTPLRKKRSAKSMGFISIIIMVVMLFIYWAAQQIDRPQVPETISIKRG